MLGTGRVHIPSIPSLTAQSSFESISVPFEESTICAIGTTPRGLATSKNIQKRQGMRRQLMNC